MRSHWVYLVVPVAKSPMVRAPAPLYVLPTRVVLDAAESTKMAKLVPAVSVIWLLLMNVPAELMTLIEW
jgi:hypothetical protein